MTVFEAFPKAIIKNVWEIGRVKRGTIEGVKFTPEKTLDVIVDEEANSNLDTTSSAESLHAGTLIYARPSQVGSANMAKFVSSYYFHNLEIGTYYEITDASIGKNQHTGVIEHIEFEINPTEIAKVENG